MKIINRYKDIRNLYKTKIDHKIIGIIKKTFLELYKEFRVKGMNICDFDLTEIGYIGVVEEKDNIQELSVNLLSDNTEAIHKVFYNNNRYLLKLFILFSNCFMPIIIVPDFIKMDEDYLNLYGIEA